MSRPTTSSSLLTLTLALVCGCSYIGKRDMVDAEEGEGTSSNATSVPKEQYDQLLAKYEAAVRDRQKGNQVTPDAPPVEKDPTKLVDDLNNANLKGELAETVDVFGKENASVPVGASPMIGDMQVEDQIKRLQEAEALLSKNQFDAAMNELRPLEKSEVGQVRVRAKTMIGDLLLRQGEFDLAMQVYEDIIHKDAFSGVVVKVLGKLIVCTEKLKLDKKKEQYYSMLHDFFEVD